MEPTKSGAGAKRRGRAAILPHLARLACYAPKPVLLGARPLLAAVLRRTSLRARLEQAMTAALGPGGFTQRHVDQYFRHLADLMAFAPPILRSGIHRAGLERNWEADPASEQRLADAHAEGRGVLMVCPHLIGVEIMTGSVTDRFPVAVVVRPSPDARYEALKQRWYAAIGVEASATPRKRSGSGGVAEMAGILRALRNNRLLGITPDLVQKPGKGIPVTLFGRRVELPAGAFFLATRTRAPLIPWFFHHEGGRYRMWTHEALTVDTGADRDEAMADLAQRWATLFEQFLRAHPDMWQFWLDKRWRQWLGAV